MRYPVWRPLLAAAAILIVSAFAVVLLSTPSDKYVYLDIESDSYRLPEDISLPIESVSSIHIRGLELNLSQIADLVITADKQSTETKKQETLSIVSKDAATSSSSLTIEPQESRGAMTLALGMGTHVRAEAAEKGSGCSVIFESAASTPVSLAIEADSVFVKEANRVTLNPPQFNTNVDHPVTYSIKAVNKISMVRGVSVPSAQIQTSQSREIKLSYPEGSQPPSLLPDNKPLSELLGTTLLLERTQIKRATIRGLKDADIVLDLPSDLALQTGSDFQWSQVLVFRRPAPENSCAFRLIGKGQVSSLRQDSRQLLPSRLSDWISGTPAEKGLLGAVAVFTLFAGGTILKRALEILAKLFLPDTK